MNLTTEQAVALAQVRSTLIERLRLQQFGPVLLEKLSVFELVNLLFLMVGHCNYVGTFTGTCRSLEESFGWDAMSEKPSAQPAQTESTPLEKETVH